VLTHLLVFLRLRQSRLHQQERLFVLLPVAPEDPITDVILLVLPGGALQLMRIWLLPVLPAEAIFVVIEIVLQLQPQHPRSHMIVILQLEIVMIQVMGKALILLHHHAIVPAPQPLFQPTLFLGLFI